MLNGISYPALTIFFHHPKHMKIKGKIRIDPMINVKTKHPRLGYLIRFPVTVILASVIAYG